MAHSTRTMVTLDLKDLEKIIRKIVRHDVRQIVREELARTGAEVVEPWMSDPESPLYQDMQDLLKRKQEGRLKFYTYEEVFGE
jgi:hypothetical protein